MTIPLFLTPEELRDLTGFALKDKQITQLRTMGMVFRINGHGRPVVTRAAVEGNSGISAPVQPTTWTPSVIAGGLRQ